MDYVDFMIPRVVDIVVIIKFIKMHHLLASDLQTRVSFIDHTSSIHDPYVKLIANCKLYP